jgi:hypothetical protein
MMMMMRENALEEKNEQSCVCVCLCVMKQVNHMIVIRADHMRSDEFNEPINKRTSFEILLLYFGTSNNIIQG